MIAFTNHALDHMLLSVLDAKITSKIVRLGSRSADERISQYSIENLEMVAGKSRLNKSFNGQYRALKGVEEQLRELIGKYVKTTLDSDEIIQYLEVQYPEELDQLNNPPPYVSILRAAAWDDGTWQVAGAGGRAKVIDDNSIYGYWRKGRDLEFLQSCKNPSPAPPPPDPYANADQNKFSTLATLVPDSSDDLHSGDESDTDGSDTDDSSCHPEEQWMKVKSTVVVEADPTAHPLSGENVPTTPLAQAIPSTFRQVEASDMRDPLAFFNAFGFHSIPQIPATDRPLEQLLEVGEVWTMSRSERERLHLCWMAAAQNFLNATQIQDFERLRGRHADVLREYNEGKDEASSFYLWLYSELTKRTMIGSTSSTAER
jgi:hypothetical protein